MANAIKHMERSHRKHSSNSADFAMFERKAKLKAGKKDLRKNGLFCTFKKIFRKGDR